MHEKHYHFYGVGHSPTFTGEGRPDPIPAFLIAFSHSIWDVGPPLFRRGAASDDLVDKRLEAR